MLYEVITQQHRDAVDLSDREVVNLVEAGSMNFLTPGLLAGIEDRLGGTAAAGGAAVEQELVTGGLLRASERSAKTAVRITSYNVCYTKLLRSVNAKKN